MSNSQTIVKAPLGVWAVAGVRLGTPYPCRCDDHESPFWSWRHACGPSTNTFAFGSDCACWGRVDFAGVPLSCCGRRKVWPVAQVLLSE